jgi:hypothetical protein
LANKCNKTDFFNDQALSAELSPNLLQAPEEVVANPVWSITRGIGFVILLKKRTLANRFAQPSVLRAPPLKILVSRPQGVGSFS